MKTVREDFNKKNSKKSDILRRQLQFQQQCFYDDQPNQWQVITVTASHASAGSSHASNNQEEPIEEDCSNENDDDPSAVAINEDSPPWYQILLDTIPELD